MTTTNNIIYNYNDNSQIGFQKDLGVFVRERLNEYAREGNWEMVKEMADIMLELGGWKDNANLLVLSDNNGMGYTIKEYEKE